MSCCQIVNRPKIPGVSSLGGPLGEPLGTDCVPSRSRALVGLWVRLRARTSDLGKECPCTLAFRLTLRWEYVIVLGSHAGKRGEVGKCYVLLEPPDEDGHWNCGGSARVELTLGSRKL